MMTSITIGGADKSGSLARILAALTRKGYLVKSQQISESPPGVKLLKIKLDGNQDKDQLSAVVKSLSPDFKVVSVAIEGALTEGISIKEIANRFPDIATLVQEYGDSFNAKIRDLELFEAGKKIGAFNYAKEWSFGSPLKMPVALRRTLVPAMEKFGRVDATDTSIALPDSPFCRAGNPCCEFLTGFMQGFLDAAPSTANTRVKKTSCRAKGDAHCTYTVDYTV